MQLRSWRGSAPLLPPPKRPFPWARTILGVGVVSLLAYIYIPDFFYVRADALVQGSLVPVASLYRVRVDRLLVGCNDAVTAGQRVAVVSNFLVQADYQRQYLQSEQQSELAEIALLQSVAQAQENAESQHQRYLAAELDEQRAADTLKSYDAGYREGVVSKIDWQDRHTELQTDAALTQSAYAAWQHAEQIVNRVLADQKSKVAVDRKLMSQSHSLSTQIGSQPLLAPVSGYIVDCVDRPANILEPGTRLFDIYSPDRAYVLGYFNPDSVAKVQIGEPADVSIAGLPHGVAGRVAAIYPDLVRLPPQLTKFFWQHVQFSEFRPVKISLDELSAADRARLYYDAQARISIALHQRGQDGSQTTAESQP
ncbi:MAG TPA: HlyD family efflux transporter periplasmic adaptor subunit [Candidatus Acidoferrales bacterium]|nr:HlyD family efflux transporter periplasmic adaptor subunit [Candidatus Acidoferrales bacterium]